jgi:hypothetical protein
MVEDTTLKERCEDCHRSRYRVLAFAVADGATEDLEPTQTLADA